MIRADAELIIRKYLTNGNLIKHSYAAEAAMKGIYRHLHNDDYKKETEDLWGITGLLHDADYEMCKDHPEKHGLLLFEKESSIPENISHAIKAHNYEYTKVMPESDLDWAIACCDQLTGFITAVALIQPEKKLSLVTVESVLKKFTSPSFAKGASRESIKACEEQLHIPLNDFIRIVLQSMQGISDTLGL